MERTSLENIESKLRGILCHVPFLVNDVYEMNHVPFLPTTDLMHLPADSPRILPVQVLK